MSWVRRVWFQSLKGFQRLWSPVAPNTGIKPTKVSIPKRVSEALKQPCLLLQRFNLTIQFQSLKGFQRLWSPTEAHYHCNLLGIVSIPKRVSEALKLRAFKHLGINERFQVSIPKRVSEALKPFPIIKPFVVCVFQSLKGFQRLWSMSL